MNCLATHVQGLRIDEYELIDGSIILYTGQLRMMNTNFGVSCCGIYVSYVNVYRP